MEGLESLAWLRLDLLGRLLLAAALGGIVGLEREVSGKPAGLRTNLLICTGAALLTELSIAVARLADPAARADPARIAAQIVSGIGFLGAGTIIQARGSVVGLTTAATLWVVAAIGMAVGARAYVEAVGTTVLVILALILLRRAEDHLVRRAAAAELAVTLDPQPGLLARVEEEIAAAGFTVETLSVDKGPDAIVATFGISGPRGRREEMIRGLLTLEGVRRVARA